MFLQVKANMDRWELLTLYRVMPAWQNPGIKVAEMQNGEVRISCQGQHDANKVYDFLNKNHIEWR